MKIFTWLKFNWFHVILIGGYLFLIICAVWRLDLGDESDRAVLHTLLAGGVVFFIFLEFNLDFMNRKRNAIYTYMMDTLFEARSLVLDASRVLGFKDEESAKEVYQRFSKFGRSGKHFFVSKIICKRFNAQDEMETIATFSLLDSSLRMVDRKGEFPDTINASEELGIGKKTFTLEQLIERSLELKNKITKIIREEIELL